MSSIMFQGYICVPRYTCHIVLGVYGITIILSIFRGSEKKRKDERGKKKKKEK